MATTRTEKLQAQREELGRLLDSLAPDDAQRAELESLVKDIDRMLQRAAPRVKVKRRQVATEPDSSVLIATVPKSERTEIRISSKIWEGRQLIDVRLYARAKDATEFKPTAKGIAIEAAGLGDLLSGLTLAQQYVPEKKGS
jgi:outer membrane translocation and assembly module TamA